MKLYKDKEDIEQRDLKWAQEKIEQVNSEIYGRPLSITEKQNIRVNIHFNFNFDLTKDDEATDCFGTQHVLNVYRIKYNVEMDGCKIFLSVKNVETNLYLAEILLHQMNMEDKDYFGIYYDAYSSTFVLGHNPKDL